MLPATYLLRKLLLLLLLSLPLHIPSLQVNHRLQ
jgi:hypothetical protein